jgi:gamma-glutamylcyclotransferase (GGCT)/AIG2-like uncharacterized protein YtfP
MSKNKILVAVYGSLRKGLGNHYYLENAKYLGNFNTEPIYNLHSLGSYPGLKENGNTSVVMEVYEVTPIEAHSIDRLEGYTPGSNSNTFYDKKDINTPWGVASVYLYVSELPKSTIVESGDWKEFKNNTSNYYSIRNN